MKVIYALLFSSLFIGSCTYIQKIQDGKTAVEYKQYDLAINLLTKEYKKTKSRVEKGKLAFLLGESYKNTGNSDQAINWYEIAYNNQYGVDALKEYAFVLKQSERYDEAKEAFKNLGFEIGSPYEFRKEIAATKVAADWLKNQNKDYKITPVDFNSNNNDYAPMFYGDNYLVFTSDRNNSTGEDKYLWTGNKFTDLYTVDLSTEEVRPFDFNINTTNNEGTATFTKDGTGMYFTRCDNGDKYTDKYCQILFSRKEGNIWTAPVPMNFTREDINYRHPFITADGNTLYFSADDKEGWGSYDLYYAQKQSDGWSEPKLLPLSVNTINGDEGFPFMDKDTLYFASSGHTGMGGLDIFRTVQRKDGSFTPSQNLKAPINSGKDDFGYIIDKKAKLDKDLLSVGYFTSSRDGNDAIYRYQQHVPPPTSPVIIAETPKEIIYKNILEGYVLEKIYADANNPNSKVLGRKPLSNSSVSVNFGKEKLNFTTAEDGFFTFDLTTDTDYRFFATHEGYLNNNAFFSSKGIAKDANNPTQKFEIEIELDKIFLNREITLENIYYDFNDDKIRSDAKPTLRALAQNLQLNPNLRIQLASHTDCRGQDNYNQSLSQRRAQSAVDFLITLGIDAGRLQAVGYGETRPKADCLCSRCTEEEHQENRRTTFAIVE